MSRRLGITIVPALAIAAGFIPWPVPAETFLKSLRAEIPSESGVTIAARSSARFTLLPAPAITLRDVAFSHASEPQLAQASQISLRLRLLPLIAGTAQVSQVIVYDVQAQATPSARSLWFATLTGSHNQGFLPQLTLVNSHFRFEQPGDAISQVNASLEWRPARKLLNVWGHAVWRGEKFRVQAAGLPMTGGLDAAEEQPAQISIETPFAALEANGTIASGRGNGALQVAMKNATHLSRWLGATVPMAGLLDQFTLSGSGVATERAIQLGDVTLTFGPNALKGTLSLTQQPGNKPLISGTLATASLELNTIANAFDAVQDASGQWNADAFDTRSLQTADFDIRISATQARIMKMLLRDAALSATLKNGRLDLALGRSAAYGGMLRSRVSIARLTDTLTEQRIQTSFDAVDFGKFSDDMFNMRLLSGVVSGQFQAESTGISPLTILNGLNGRGTLAIAQGELTGISLTDTVRQAERAQAQLIAMQSGSTRFDSGAATLQFQNGIVQIQDGRINGTGAQAAIGGQINLSKKEYQLTGAVQHPLRPRQWPFEISGPWSKPAIRMMSQAPAQRSDQNRNGSPAAESRS